MTGNPLRLAAAVCAAGLLPAISACGLVADDSGDEDSDAVDAASSEIRSWSEVCDVFAPDAIAEQLGAEYVDDSPVEVPARGGMFIGALSCNSLFRLESDPDQSQGFMYLNLSPSDDAELAKEQYDELWETDYDNHLHQGSNAGMMLASQDDMPGEWDEAASFVSIGGSGDRVWAYYLKGAYLVQIQLSWGPDSEILYAALNEEDDPMAFAELDFDPIEIAGWVKNTYLPQVYEDIEAKIAADVDG